MYAIRSYYVLSSNFKNLERHGMMPFIEAVPPREYGHLLGCNVLGIDIEENEHTRDALLYTLRLVSDDNREMIASPTFPVITSYSIHYTKLYDGL